MKVELKNVKINKTFSEETTCFTASVYINGKKAAYAKNGGYGGATDYYAEPGYSDLVKEAETYFKNLPPEKLTLNNGNVIEIKQSLEHVIDNLLVQKEREKEEKDIQKLCERNVVWGNENKTYYKYMGFKGKHTLDDVRKSPNGKASLDKLINLVKSKMQDGEVIYNKNI